MKLINKTVKVGKPYKSDGVSERHQTIFVLTLRKVNIRGILFFRKIVSLKTNTRMKKITAVLVLGLLFSACKKEAGEGGNSLLRGKVILREYTAFPILYTESEAPDEDVFIVYGEDDNTIDDRTRTSYDGTYKFQFLNKGKYKIFAYTEDTTLATLGQQKVVIKEVEITKNQSEVEVPTITIIKVN